MRRGGGATAGALLFLLGACGTDERGGGAAAPDSPAGASRAAGPALWFTDVTAASGLGAFSQVNGDREKIYITGSVGAGVGTLDHDGDGDWDVFLTNGSYFDRPLGDDPPTDALFANEGDGTFTDRTAEAGVADELWTCGVRVVDFDGDGWDEPYLTNHGPNRLYRNRGDGTFADVSAAAGVDVPGWSTGAAFFDFDHDGDLDLYVANYIDIDRQVLLEDKPRQSYHGVSVFYGPLGLDGAADRFLVQTEPGRWEDRSAHVGITGKRLYGFQAVAFDADEDGWLDVYVANDSRPNLLWRNRGGERFEDMAVRAGLALSMDGVAQAGMGVTVGDYDGDLVTDLYVTNFAEDYFTLYRGEGRGFFSDVTARVQLRIPTTESLGWGCGFVDFDHDGDEDLYAVNGHVYPQVDLVDLGTRYAQRNLLFENTGGRFREPPAGAGPGFELEAVSRGSAVLDFDGDGDMDVLVGNLDGPPTLLRNDGAKAGNWIQLLLVGRGLNRHAIGARLVLRFGGRSVLRLVGTAGSFLSSSDRRIHVGLGPADRVDELEVTWPDGTVERFEDLAAGALVTIDQDEGIR